jgi:hypothetical protein
MVDKVSEFPSGKSGQSAGMNETSYFKSIVTFLLKAELFDMPDDGDFTNDVELQQPQSNESFCGPLSPFEKQAYCLARVLESILRDMMVELEAGGTEKIIAIQREKRVPFVEAARLYAEANDGPPMTDEERTYMNTVSVLMNNMMGCFEWGVRSRYDLFDKGVSVRSGFILYSE